MAESTNSSKDEINDQLNKLKKKNQKLEEGYIKINSDLKNLKNDKAQIESFLKSIFPKETHESSIHVDFGLYECDELKKIWMVSETKRENEFQKVLNLAKQEASDINEKYKHLCLEFDLKCSEINNIRKTLEDSQSQLTFYINNFKSVQKKNLEVESEKTYLLQMIDDKNKEIEKLQHLELEIAEIRACNLLGDEDHGGDYDSNKNGFNYFGNYSENKRPENDATEKIKRKGESSKKINKEDIRIDYLNSGTQTSESIYTEDQMNILIQEREEIKIKLEKLKVEFSEYKNKAHKMILASEDNYNRIFKENQSIKNEFKDFKEKNMHNNHSSSKKLNEYDLKLSKNNYNNTYYTKIGGQSNNSSSSLTEIDKMSGKMEYLKNVTLKYLESVSMGNEFQSKILENVIFSVLNVSPIEKNNLEAKRLKSSFYYSIWYNAKNYISSKIYGPTSLDDSYSLQSRNNGLKLHTMHDNNSINFNPEELKKNDKINETKISA